MEDTKQIPTGVVIVPTPGMGHLIPLAEFARRLVFLHHGLTVTFIIPNDGLFVESQKKLLQTLPTSVSFTFLPPVSFSDLPEDSKIETRIALTLTRSIIHVRESFKVIAESTRVVALVVDLFGTEVFELAKEFSVKPYIFFPSTAMALSLALYLPELDETTSCEYRDLPEPVRLPGCVPIQANDLTEPIQDRKNDAYKRVLQMVKGYNLAAGILVNSFLDLEPGAFKALKQKSVLQGTPPVFPVGPLTQTGSSSTHGIDEPADKCLSWLNKQPKESVLFISFGSGGTLSQEQFVELALGLEMSGQRFIWVVKCPNDKKSNATYFGDQGLKDPLEFLPEGFLERTKEVGLLVTNWAPQVQILSHESTGGFLSHCGWNSSLESIVNGVPLIAWPLFAEQRMNAVLLADDLKVALRVKVNEKGLVVHQNIANNARCLIEGDEGKLLRDKVRQLKEAARMVLTEEGSSTTSLAEVVQIWKTHKD